MDLRVATRERNKAARHEGKVKMGGAWIKWAELKLQKNRNFAVFLNSASCACAVCSIICVGEGVDARSDD